MASPERDVRAAEPPSIGVFGAATGDEELEALAASVPAARRGR